MKRSLATAAFVAAAFASPAAHAAEIHGTLHVLKHIPLKPVERGTSAGAPSPNVVDPLAIFSNVTTAGVGNGFAQNPSAPVKSIFMVYNAPPYSIVARKSRRITEPKLLEGRKLGAAPAGATLGIWPLFAKLNGIDAGKVAIEEVNNLVRIPMLAAGQIDGTLGFTFRDYVDFKDRGVPVDDIVLLHMPDFGLKTYGSAIIVNSKVAAENPEAIKGFLRALLRGLKETVDDPASAIGSVVKRDDMERKEIELERLIIAIRDNVVTPEVRANGYGAIDPVRFEEMISQIALAHTFKARPKADDIFDGSYLPLPADRKVD